MSDIENESDSSDGEVAAGALEASPTDSPAHPKSDVTDETRAVKDGESFRHTRISSAWVAVAVAVIFGVALVVFIAQNTRRFRVDFFTLSARISVATALLAAALGGAMVVLAIGVGRVTQLRLNMRRQRRATRKLRDHGVGANQPETRGDNDPAN